MTAICLAKAARVINEYRLNVSLALWAVTCNPMSASCFDYAAEISNVKAVGCNLHLSLNCLLCTLNAKPVKNAKML